MTSHASPVRALLALATAASLALGVAACGDDSSDTASAASASSPASACPNGSLKFGIEPFEDPAKLTPAYEALSGALAKKLNCKVELQIVEDYAAEVLAMQHGKLDIAQFGPLGYVFAHDRAKAEAVASFADATGQLTTYKAGIWVPKDSPIQSVADLKGKSLALGDEGSTSGDALPREALLKAGLEESDVKLSYTGGHPQAMLALTHGKIDAAEVNTQQAATGKSEGQWDASKYREIWASDPIPNDPITVAGDLPAATKTAITDALLGLDKADVAKVGAFLDVDPPGPLVAVTQQTYQPLFDLASDLHLTEKDA